MNDIENPQHEPRRNPIWRRLLEHRRNRRLSLKELHELRDAATRVPCRQLQIFLGLIDMQLQRGGPGAEQRRLRQMRCHVASRIIVEKQASLGHLPGGVKLEVVLADVCRCISEGFRDGAPQSHLYRRLSPIDIDRDTALPIALLLSESLSECMGHVCDQPYQRRIDVALTRLDSDEAELSIRDNCYQSADLAKGVLQDNPLPHRFALRSGANLRVADAPHFSLQLTFPIPV
jgi:two-component sensor histidine kinase